MKITGERGEHNRIPKSLACLPRNGLTFLPFTLNTKRALSRKVVSGSTSTRNPSSSVSAGSSAPRRNSSAKRSTELQDPVLPVRFLLVNDIGAAVAHSENLLADAFFVGKCSRDHNLWLAPGLGDRSQHLRPVEFVARKWIGLIFLWRSWDMEVEGNDIWRELPCQPNRIIAVSRSNRFMAMALEQGCELFQVSPLVFDYQDTKRPPRAWVSLFKRDATWDVVGDGAFQNAGPDYTTRIAVARDSSELPVYLFT